MVKELKRTSIEQMLNQIKTDVAIQNKQLVEDLQNNSPQDLTDLPDTLSQKYKLEYLYKIKPHFETIYRLQSNGYTESQIAETLGVSKLLFRKCKQEIPELQALMIMGNEEKIDKVEATMFQTAMGIEYYEEAVNNKTGAVVKLRKTALPNFNAQKYILGNLRAGKYTDQRQVITRVELGEDVRQSLFALSNDDLRSIIGKTVIEAEFVEKNKNDDTDEDD